MARASKTNRINIFKLRQDINLTNFSSINEYEKIFSNEKSALFIQKDKKSIPEWSKFILPLAPKVHFENSSNSFIYLIKHKDNLYALTGGYGFKVIQDDIDEEFGLNVALRLIDNLSISSIHQFSVKSQTRQIQRSVANYNPSFDNENYNKILKSISGKGQFSGKNFLVQGKSSIVLRTEKDINNIEQVLDEIDDILNKEEKIKLFKSYKKVSDKKLIKKLNSKLYRELCKFYKNENNLSSLYLDLPDPFKKFDYSRYDLFIKNKHIEIDELDIDEIRSVIRQNFHNDLSIRELLNIKIIGITIENEDDIYHKNSLDKLVVYETHFNEKYYIKLEGKWFEVLDNIISFIEDRISNITVKKNYLPKWDTNNIKKQLRFSENVYAEQIYNNETAKVNGFKLLDRKLIQIDKSSKIELADLYDSHRNYFIHVKNVWGAKASYLFSQAHISSTLYANSKEFKAKCKEKFNIPEQGKKTVVIAIAIESKNIKNFPFNMSYFAKLSLYRAVNNIRNDGYDVILTPIEII